MPWAGYTAKSPTLKSIGIGPPRSRRGSVLERIRMMYYIFFAPLVSIRRVLHAADGLVRRSFRSPGLRRGTGAGNKRVSSGDLVTRNRMLFAGIDIGSLSTDVVLLDPKGEIAGSSIVATGASTKKACEEAVSRALAGAGAAPSAVVFTVSTGYGREMASSADHTVTEITCHARGARHLFPEARTVLDIGGQDSKVIRLTPDGKVADFAMNDKCAAGTGRFLEVMARTLEMDLEEMGYRSLLSRRTVAVSSMCTVFAESEVVSLIASGTPPEDTARGTPLASRTGLRRSPKGWEWLPPPS